MLSETLKAFLRLGIFVGGCGLLMVFFQPPGSPEFILSVCSALIGGLLVLGAVLISRKYHD